MKNWGNGSTPYTTLFTYADSLVRDVNTCELSAVGKRAEYDQNEVRKIIFTDQRKFQKYDSIISCLENCVKLTTFFYIT
jgi:hypothetical protein